MKAATTLEDTMLYTDDCLFALKRHVPDCSVDLIVTSPPYLDAREGSYKSVKPSQYERWFLLRAAEFKRVLKPTGSLVLNLKNRVDKGQRTTYVLDLVSSLIHVGGWHWVDEYIWHKTNPLPTGSKRRLKDGWEPLYHFTRTSRYFCDPDALAAPSTSRHAGEGKRRRNKGRHSTRNGSGITMSRRFEGELVRPSNVIHCPVSSLNLEHPAAFPETIPDRFIRLLTKPAQVVLDPFMGSGTTGLAALKAGRQFIGVDAEARFVKLARQRLKPLVA
jgi:DNA modification methylase